MRNLDNKAKILIADIRQISWRNQIMFVIALYCFSISKEKIDQVISLALHKLAKKDIERFWSAGIKASLINVKSPSYFKKWKILTLIMMQNQIVFSFFFFSLYFEHERLWHHHAPELDIKSTESPISGEVKFWI